MWFLLCWQGDGAADPGIDNEESQEASDSIQKQADSQSSGTKTHAMHSFLMLMLQYAAIWKKVLGTFLRNISDYQCWKQLSCLMFLWKLYCYTFFFFDG